MSAAFNNIMRLTVTQEFVNELRRSATNTHDPILEFALQLPTLPGPPNGVSEQLIGELAAIVFPVRATAGTLTVQDRSDLIHLAITAHHKIVAFVTAEDALVRASQAIETSFGVRILHVKDLAETLKFSDQCFFAARYWFCRPGLTFIGCYLKSFQSYKRPRRLCEAAARIAPSRPDRRHSGQYPAIIGNRL
jgi:hypothetical protein